MDPTSNPKGFTIKVKTKQIISNQGKSYQVTPSGVKESPRVNKEQKVRIGRLQSSQYGYNDIVLPQEDRFASRIHCYINYERFFSDGIPPDWLAFLMGTHPKLGSKSPVKYLSVELCRYILEFLKQPKLFLVDLGSIWGTYIRLEEPVSLEPGMYFCIGEDTLIDVVQLTKTYTAKSLGLADRTHLETLDQVPPFIQLQVSSKSLENEEVQKPMFAKTSKETFTIGKSETADLKVFENSILDCQCKIKFKKNKWFVVDKTKGTWLSLRKRKAFEKRGFTPFKLSNGSQFKVSETVMQVEWKK